MKRTFSSTIPALESDCARLAPPQAMISPPVGGREWRSRLRDRHVRSRIRPCRVGERLREHDLGDLVRGGVVVGGGWPVRRNLLVGHPPHDRRARGARRRTRRLRRSSSELRSATIGQGRRPRLCRERVRCAYGRSSALRTGRARRGSGRLRGKRRRSGSRGRRRP